MNRKLRPKKSTQEIKDKQIGFLLEVIEQDIEEYKNIIGTKNKQLTDIKKILKGAKNSYQELTKENKQLEQYMANIKYHHQQQQQQQQYFRPKKYKKGVYEEETDSETEQDQEETPELEEIEQQNQQQQQTKDKIRRKIGTEVEIGKTISAFESIGKSSVIDRSASVYTNAREEVQKIKQLISTGTYDADIAKYIPGTLDLVYQGMLEDIDTQKKASHISY